MKKLSLPVKFGILLVLLMAPVLVVISLMYKQQEKILTNQISDTLNELIEQNNLVIESEFDRIFQQTTSVVLDSATQNIRTESNQDEYEIFQDIRYLENLLTNHSITDKSNLNYHLVFPDNGLSNQNAYHISNIRDRNILFIDGNSTPEWYENALNNKGKFSLELVESNGESTIALTRAINDLSNYRSTLGVLVVSNIENLLAENLGNSISYEIIPYMLNESGEILFEENINFVDWSQETLTHLTDPEIPDFDIITDEEIFIKESNSNYNYSIVFRVPLDRLTEQQMSLRNIAFFLTTIYLLIAFFIAYYIAKLYVVPLQKLTRFFRFYIPGNIADDFKKYEGRGEVGRLMIAVRNLSYRVNRLIKDKYQAQMKSKDIELKMLHEQINPHLLYNTLDSIQWNSIANEDFDTASMISDLSSLLRIGLSNGKSLINLEEEIDHVSAYVNLQKKRYDYDFIYENNIDKNIFNQLVPKITLQPLIENSIKYGIKNMGNEGKITLDSKLYDEYFEIILSDNGFKDIDIDNLNKSLKIKEPDQGVGIFNVEEKIKHYFGSTYGLLFERSNDITKAIIKLPINNRKD